MIDMKLTPEAKTLLSGEVANTQEYPYGLRICLDRPSLTKLGITEMPAVGAKVKVSALASVVGVSQYESENRPAQQTGEGHGKPNRTVELQIEAMELAFAEEGAKGDRNTAQSMYSNSGMNP